ncbi:hypothetical protein [Candidatus Uabimicrobium sp. HlEnr_7]|uniref:hypothetical protein n=1 Tax=Candidatus Uabimicrobium helgolandensis TaxID=3095367 RepID=UPI0035565B82
MVNNYEFTPEQDKIFAELAKNVRFVGTSILIIVVLKVITFFFVFSTHQILLIVDLLVICGIAISHFFAAKSLKLVVDTKGNDIAHFMNAMKNFNRFYFLYYWAFVIFILSTTLSYILGGV